MSLLAEFDPVSGSVSGIEMEELIVVDRTGEPTYEGADLEDEEE